MTTSIAQLSHTIAALLQTQPSPLTRFEVMAVAEALLVQHDQTRDQALRLTIRSWIGRLQEHHGL